MVKRGSHNRQSGHARSARRPEPRTGIPAAFKPAKPREYGTTKAVVGEAFKQAGGTKMVGAFFDLSQSVIYGFTDPDAKGCDLSLDRARRLTYVEGVHAFADDFAQLAGGIFLSPNKVDAGEHLADIGGDVSHRVADVVADVLAAVQDGKITDQERSELLYRCDCANAAIIALRARLMESGTP